MIRLSRPRRLLVYSDEFNRANENPIPGWEEIGGVGFGYDPLEVISNQAGSGAGGAWQFYEPETFGPDLQLTMQIAAGAEGGDFYMDLGLNDADGELITGYEFVFGGDFSWSIFRYDSMEDYFAVGSAAPSPPTVADGDSIRFRRLGGTFSAWHKPAAGSWSQVVSGSDSTYSGIGHIGIALPIGGAGRIDNLTVEEFAPASIRMGDRPGIEVRA